MNVYRVSNKVKKLYIAVGVLFLFLAVATLIFRPLPYAKLSLNIVFYVFVIGLAYLHLTRHRTFKLYVNDFEIYCYNGLLNVKHIPLEIIEKIEYNPSTRILIHTNRRNGIYKIPGVFSEEDLMEILDCIKKKRSEIQIVYLENPKNTTEKGEK